MRSALIKKLSIFIFITVIFNTTSQGQCECQKLDIPAIGQKTKNWCWAACMEMIFQFYNTPINMTQCFLAKERLSLGLKMEQAEMDETTNPCCTCGVTNNCNDDYDQTIEFYNQNSGTDLMPHSFDVIFSKWRYHSTEQINRLTLKSTSQHVEIAMSWAEVKNQIEKCRPFIMLVNKGTRHAILAKGYYEDKDLGIKQIYVNDPLKQLCGGQEYVLPYDNVMNSRAGFAVSSDLFIYQVLAVVQNIYPKDTIDPKNNDESCRYVTGKKQNCCPTPGVTSNFMQNGSDISSITASIKSSDGIANELTKINDPDTLQDEGNLMNILIKNAAKAIGFSKIIYSNSQYQENTNQDSYYKVPIMYISFERMLNVNKPELRLTNVITPNQVEEVVSRNVTPNVVSIFERDKKSDSWFCQGITFAKNSAIKPMINIQYKKANTIVFKTTLTNKAPTSDSLLYRPYRIAQYLQFLYEFYSFEYKGETYLSPVSDYPELELQAGFAYDEKTVLTALKKLTDDYQNAGKKEIDKAIDIFKTQKKSSIPEAEKRELNQTIDRLKLQRKYFTQY